MNDRKLKTGRNDPCPCGSGLKYKKCCLGKREEPASHQNWLRMRQIEGKLIPLLIKHAAKDFGAEALSEAWDEFTLWEEVPLDPESEPELDTAFLPWYVFNWIPDNTGIEEDWHYPEMPIALHYLREKGSRLDAFERRFIEEICSEPYSFFLVTSFVPGQSLTLRDLLLNRELTVHERQASTMLKKGCILFTRTITIDADSIMVGCAPSVIPPTYFNDILELRERIRKSALDLGPEALFEFDIELRQLYYAIRDAVRYPPPPDLRNTDGDPLEFTQLAYQLHCAPREAVEALASLSLSEAAELFEQAEFDAQGDLLSIEFPWLRKGNPKLSDLDNTVLGQIRIEGQSLTIDVNSRQRADAIRRKVTYRLGKRAIFNRAESHSLDELMEEHGGQSNSGEPIGEEQVENLMALPEVQQKIKKMASEHWKTWLDTPIPALMDETPREAARTSIGHERLEVLLLQFEAHRSAANLMDPDTDELRRSLGLS